MRSRYLASSPYNLVRVILGERSPADNDSDNVYTRAASHFNAWIQQGILTQDPTPGYYAYFQEFEVPDTGERAVRKGFIGLGKVEDYAARVVYRHEQTLSGPKKDRRQVLDHTRAHFGQLFMLYPDREAAVDALLDQATAGPPLMDVRDDYQARHKLWAITDPALVTHITALMADKKLLIADGHHRYETALGYRDDHLDDPAAQYVMMTFVNMYSPGLKILATHRVLRNLDGFDVVRIKNLTRLDSVDALKRESTTPHPASVRIGVVTVDAAYLFERPRVVDELDVPVLHTEILGEMLGINEESVREEKYITYVRGFDAAVAEVREKGAQVAFLLEPTPIDDMARVAFAGGVMPQKSTDFYPKLLTGVAIYRL